MNPLKMELIRRMLDARDKLVADKHRLQVSFWRFLPWNRFKIRAIEQHIDRLDKKLFGDKGK